MGRCCEKTFFERKICFMCSLILFLSTPAYFSCNIKLFVLTQNYFSCNTKFLFWTLFRMLCHVDIFLLSRSNKNIATYQKKYFYVTQNINFLFCVSQIFYVQFLYCTWKDFGLLCISSRNKETFKPSFTLSDIRKQLLRAALEKRSSYYPGLFIVKNL